MLPADIVLSTAKKIVKKRVTVKYAYAINGGDVETGSLSFGVSATGNTQAEADTSSFNEIQDNIATIEAVIVYEILTTWINITNTNLEVVYDYQNPTQLVINYPGANGTFVTNPLAVLNFPLGYPQQITSMNTSINEIPNITIDSCAVTSILIE